MINIDAATAPPPGRLSELVTAVFNAQPADECDLAEWKSQLELSTKHGQFTLARAILGFANRNPTSVTQHLSGTAYILAGVEPGHIHSDKIRSVTPPTATDRDPPCSDPGVALARVGLGDAVVRVGGYRLRSECAHSVRDTRGRS